MSLVSFKEKMSKEILIAIVLLAIFALVSIGIYNKLVAARNATTNAFGQIDVQLKRRHDLIPNLVEVSKKYLEHEAATLQAVIQARSQATQAAAPARANPADPKAMAALSSAEGVLGGALGRLLMVSESYPDLKADGIMSSLSEELGSTENRITFSRQHYNDCVLDYNNFAQQFPNNIVARLTAFQSLPMLQSTQNNEERNAPKVTF